MPFQDDDRPQDGESLYDGERPGASPDGPSAHDPSRAVDVDAAPSTDLLPPAETQTDLLAARVQGPDDHEGMTALWRETMGLAHWWFIAVGDEGHESPAAAQIDGQMMLLTFTNAERARHFAVQNGMISVEEDLRAIALPPPEVVDSDEAYAQAGIAGLMFDPHITGYFMPSEQLSVVWTAIRSGG